MRLYLLKLSQFPQAVPQTGPSVQNPELMGDSLCLTHSPAQRNLNRENTKIIDLILRQILQETSMGLAFEQFQQLRPSYLQVFHKQIRATISACQMKDSLLIQTGTSQEQLILPPHRKIFLRQIQKTTVFLELSRR